MPASPDNHPRSAEEIIQEHSDAAAAAAEKWKNRTLRDALESASQPPPWVIEDVLLKDSATLVSAHPHAMKSLSLLCVCIQAPAVGKVWGHFAAPSVKQTLFIETEDPPWLVEARIRGLAKGLRLDPDGIPGFGFVCPGPFDLVAETGEVTRLVKEYAPDFWVLSTLQNAIGGRSINKPEEMAPVVATLLGLARIAPGAVITHSPWQRRQKRAAGTVTLAANFLTAVHYEKVKAKDGSTAVHLSIDSKAGALDEDFYLTLTTNGSPRDPSSVRSIDYGGPGWPRGGAKDSILEMLETDPSLTPAAIAERTNSSPQYVRRVIREYNELRPGKRGKKLQ